MKKPKFIPFDASGYLPPHWVPGFLKNAFEKPKDLPMWDARKPGQLERLQSLADGIKQFLDQLPDGAEIGSTALAKCLVPDLFDNEHFAKFVIARIERVRYHDMLGTHFYSVPDERWKTPRTFYKYHNGKGQTDDLASLR